MIEYHIFQGSLFQPNILSLAMGPTHLIIYPVHTLSSVKGLVVLIYSCLRRICNVDVSGGKSYFPQWNLLFHCASSKAVIQPM